MELSVGVNKDLADLLAPGGVTIDGTPKIKALISGANHNVGAHKKQLKV
jgi:hypothetical protein